MFGTYTDELEYSLKEQERSGRAGSTAPLRIHIGELSQELPHGKNYQEFLSNTENKSQLLKKLEKNLLVLTSVFILLLAATPSASSPEYQKRVFQRLVKDTFAAHLIEKIGESANASENLTYQVMCFIQKYTDRGKTNYELVEIRMRQYYTMKTKTTKTILPDPHSLKEQIKRANLQAYYWWHY